MKVLHPTIPLQQSQPDAEALIKGGRPERRVYKLVLTGGPCGGKTTGQAMLATFFENLGWKVFRVPETATVLMSGGIAFGDLNEEQVMDFQVNLIKTMLSLEDTYFSMAEKTVGQNVLVICDRGTMDASAYISPQEWERLLDKLDLEESHICENRYDQIVHMVSAANGAEDFYSVEDHAARFEGLELARERDRKAMEAWSEHPYVDIVDNKSDFDSKLNHLVDLVVKRIGLEIGDRFKANSRKVKFVVRGKLPEESKFPKFTDFDVVHHYLQANRKGIQSRLRKRSRLGRCTYTCTVRRPERKGQIVEVKSTLSRKEYENLLNHADPRHYPVFKTRRCFLYNNQQYQLDIYRDPCHPRCKDMMLLETFTTVASDDVINSLPPFLKICKEVTGDPAFSMYNLALKSEWIDNAHDFCQKLESDEDAVEDDDEDEDDLEDQESLLDDDLDKENNNNNNIVLDEEEIMSKQKAAAAAAAAAAEKKKGQGSKKKVEPAIILLEDFDDGELNLKRHQLDVLQAHQRLLRINRRGSTQSNNSVQLNASSPKD